MTAIGSDAWRDEVRALRRRYQLDKVALGACSSLPCINPAGDGYSSCDGCRVRALKAYHKPTKEGDCARPGCARPATAETKTCEMHRRKDNARARRQRAWRKRQGL